MIRQFSATAVVAVGVILLATSTASACKWFSRCHVRVHCPPPVYYCPPPVVHCPPVHFGHPAGYGHPGFMGYPGFAAARPAPLQFARTPVAAAAPVAPAAEPARVIVSLPANASLIVDGQRTNGASDQRIFETPPLQKGENYFYTMTVQVTEDDGAIRSATERIYVRAGQTTQVELALPENPSSVAAR